MLTKAKEILNENGSFVVIDIETTGFLPSRGGFIIEVAGAKVIDGIVKETYTRLINPASKISKKITDLTGITNEMLENEASYGVVLREFIAFIGDLPVVAHNAAFDWFRFMRYYSNTLGIYLNNDVICTNILYKELNPGVKKSNLAVVAEDFGISFEGDAHRALNDVMVTAQVFLKMKDGVNELNIEPFEDEGGHDASLGVNKKMKVTRATYWQKKVGKKLFKRIYVGITEDFRTYSNAYLDLSDFQWYIKDHEGSIDWMHIQNQTLEKFSVSTLEELAEIVKKDDDLLTSKF